MNTKSQIPNGTYTLINIEKKTHRTFRIYTVRKGKLEGKRIIGILAGPDNVTNYISFAFLNDDDTFHIWKKHLAKKKYAQCLSILISLMIEEEKSRYHDRVEVKLSKHCLRCNRKLTVPQSIADGIGPECIKMM